MFVNLALRNSRDTIYFHAALDAFSAKRFSNGEIKLQGNPNSLFLEVVGHQRWEGKKKPNEARRCFSIRSFR